jgi:uncharacterized integral membrane protein
MLSGIRRVLWVVLLLLIAAATLLLILQNPQRTQFHFLQWSTPELPFSVLLVVTFMFGALCSMLLSLRLMGRLLRERNALRAQRKD